MSAALKVMQKFMRALDETTLIGRAAVDEAIRSCSTFDGLDGLIENFIADCESASTAEEFLLDKCGIDLDNEDTGAITGSDAGGSIVKTAKSIIPGKSGAVDYPEGTSFELDGLSVNVPSRNTLDDVQQRIIRDLYGWQLKGAFDLIKESYGDNYSFDPRGAAKVRTLEIKFVSSGAFMARAGHRYALRTGETTALALQINTGYCDADGQWSGEVSFERVLAHEMTHAVMAANINYYSELPSFIKEGVAELTHGIDDQRRAAIESLSKDATNLRAALSSSGGMMYTAGYMLMRYFARQAAR